MSKRIATNTLWLRLLATIGNATMIALIAWMLAQWSWQLVAPPPSFSSLSTQHLQQHTPTHPESTTPHNDPAFWQSWFGTHISLASVPEKSAVINTPATTLDARLLGILSASSNSVIPRAMIVGKGIPERTYGIGDTLGSAVIREIAWDRVVLEHHGALESLSLPKISHGESHASQHKISDETQQLMEKLWHEFELKPESILENIRIEPYFDGQGFRGVRLFPGRDPKFLEPFGVRAGDLVTWVNGVELTDPLKGMEVLGKLGAARSMQFRVTRGTESLAFEFQRQTKR